MQTSKEFRIKFIRFDRLATHHHFQFVDREDMNDGPKSDQFTSRPVSIAPRFVVEDIYTFAALKQFRNQFKRTLFFALIILVFQTVIAHFSCSPVLNGRRPQTASHINADTYLIYDLTIALDRVTFSLHFLNSFFCTLEGWVIQSYLTKEFFSTPTIACHLYMVSFKKERQAAFPVGNTAWRIRSIAADNVRIVAVIPVGTGRIRGGPAFAGHRLLRGNQNRSLIHAAVAADIIDADR